MGSGKGQTRRVKSSFVPEGINSIPIMNAAGGREWHVDGKGWEPLHREDGPAVEYPDGGQFWYINNEKHRVGGPAVVLANGFQEWYEYGLLHRMDGPAVIYQ